MSDESDGEKAVLDAANPPTETRPVTEEDLKLASEARAIGQYIIGLADMVAQGHGDDNHRTSGNRKTNITIRARLNEFLSATENMSSTKALKKKSVDDYILTIKNDMQLLFGEAKEAFKKLRRKEPKIPKAKTAEKILEALKPALRHIISVTYSQDTFDEVEDAVRSMFDHRHVAPYEAAIEVTVRLLEPHNVSPDAVRQGAALRTSGEEIADLSHRDVVLPILWTELRKVHPDLD